MTDQTAAGEPRIAPLTPEEMSEEGRALVAKLRANYGLSDEYLPDSTATMLRHPAMYGPYIDYVTERTRASVAPRRDLELVILRTGRLCGSGYIWGEHVRFGRQAGLTGEEIEWLVEGSAAPGWNQRDRALNRLCEELHETAHVSDETWAVIAENFTDQQIIEIISIIGSYHEVAFLYNAIRVRPIPGNPGLSAR
jgi:4-carboxymuconolactone decarboxylase